MDSVRELIEANFRVSNDKTSRKKESMKICPRVKVVKVGEGRKKRSKFFERETILFFFFLFFFAADFCLQRAENCIGGRREGG